jgi:hypothetical protein
MKFIQKLILITIMFSGYIVYSQTYFGGKFRKIRYTYDDKGYQLYDFSREGSVSTKIKAKYFATSAYSQYQNWKSNKTILLVAPGAFSSGWDAQDPPVGLCVDNGTIINKTADKEMDGLVIIYNGASQIGGVAVVDLDKKKVKCETTYGSGEYAYYSPRDYASHATTLLNWGGSQGLTVFQTQLVYSEKKSHSENFSNLFYGNKRERRFLALCKKKGTLHHVIIDAPDNQYLIKGTKNVKRILEEDGFDDILYILNLDTGDKNLLYVYNGSYLEDLDPMRNASQNSKERADIKNATNLIVYYKD